MINYFWLVANLVANGCQRGWQRIEQDGTHSIGCFSRERGHHMAVDVHGGPHLRVPEQLHHDPRMDALGQQQGGGGMSAVVQSDVPNAGPLQQGTPVVVVGFLVDRAAIGLGEDQIVVVPLVRRQHPLAELRGLMSVQRGDERHRQRDRSFAALRLRRFEDQPDAGDALQGPPHRQRVVDQIDVFPLQSERFGLAQAQGESDGPAGRVAQTGRRGQHGSGLVQIEGRRHVARLLGRRVDQRGDVAVNAPSLHGDLQRAGQHSVDAQNARGGETPVEQVGVEPVEVFRLQPIESMTPDARCDVDANHGCVALQCSRSYAADRDVGEPVVEPCCHRVDLDRADAAGLALDLELADLSHNLGPGSTRPVPAIPLAVGPYADGDPAVPATVLGPEDAGFSR